MSSIMLVATNKKARWQHQNGGS